LRAAGLVEDLADGAFHLFDGDVGARPLDDGLAIPARANGAIDVLELRKRGPPGVAFPPRIARREPHRKRFGEVLVGMLLRVPAGKMAYEIAAEGNGPVLFTIASSERTERSTPLGGLVEAIRVVECVPRLVTQVHHHLARALELVPLPLDSRESLVGEIERNADDRMARRTSPLVREVVPGMPPADSLRLELAREPMQERFDRRALDREPQRRERLIDELGDVLWSRGRRGGRGLLDGSFGTGWQKHGYRLPSLAAEENFALQTTGSCRYFACCLSVVEAHMV
jgi:hypothetical protein